MTTIKKVYQEVHELLESNKDKKVSSLMPQLIELMESKQRDKNHEYRDGVLWIYCYYHKEWENTEEIEYGSKASTPTKLNTMCKAGVNQWTKQQRDYSKGKNEVLELLLKGDIDTERSKEIMGQLEIQRTQILR